MEKLLLEWGLPALFLVSFLAATVAPVGSEFLLAAMLINGHDPWASVSVASAGNYLGACTTWYLGKLGGAWYANRKGPSEDKRRLKAYLWMRRYGSWALLLTWLPLVGDALCFVAGALRVGFIRFSAFTFVGKTARYSVLAALIV